MVGRLRLRDLLFRCHVGNLRLSAVRTSETVMQQAKNWSSSSSFDAMDVHRTQLWGEYMAGCAMLSAFQKGEERIKLSVQTPAIDDLYVEAMALGEVRGKIVMHADYQQLEQRRDPSDPTDESSLLGQMQVTKILYGMYKPFETVVDAVGDPQQDWQAYYDRSEQIPTQVRLKSVWNHEKALCCGVTIQKMPPVARQQQQLDDVQLELEDLALQSTCNDELLVELLGQTMDLKRFLHELLPPKAHELIKNMTIKQIPLDYFCRCSKPAFATKLQTLGHDALESVRHEAARNETRGVDLNCHFCNAKYHFSVADLSQLTK